MQIRHEAQRVKLLCCLTRHSGSRGHHRREQPAHRPENHHQQQHNRRGSGRGRRRRWRRRPRRGQISKVFHREARQSLLPGRRKHTGHRQRSLLIRPRFRRAHSHFLKQPQGWSGTRPRLSLLFHVHLKYSKPRPPSTVLDSPGGLSLSLSLSLCSFLTVFTI